MTEHVLKCWPQYFDAVKRGEKNFEVRRDDSHDAIGSGEVSMGWAPSKASDEIFLNRVVHWIKTGSHYWSQMVDD